MSSSGPAGPAPEAMSPSSARGDESSPTTPHINRNSFASADTSRDRHALPPVVFSRFSDTCTRRRPGTRRCVRGGAGHDWRGRDPGRSGGRGRPARGGGARVRPGHFFLRDQRRPWRVSHRRAARRTIPAGDSAPSGPALHQRRGGCPRRAGRHRGNHAARGRRLRADGLGDAAGVPGARGREELGLSGGASTDSQERRGPAGRVPLRPGPAGRGDRHQRLPQRHHRPRRQPAREPVRGGQRGNSQHQCLREFCVGWRHGEPP